MSDTLEGEARDLIAQISALQAEWQVTDQELAAALGVPAASWVARRSSGYTSLEQAFLVRGHALIEIGVRLKIVFPKGIAAVWMSRSHREFDHRRPIKVCTDLSGLRTVLQYVQAMCEGG